MNSEELEQSLRSEFETYLNYARAEMRREAEEFQKKIEAEFERQKSTFNDAFRTFTSRFDSNQGFDEGFAASVTEHLRLARDEGARITADAMAAAEKLSAESKPAEASYDAIRDAVADISKKDSQSTILKALVQNAGRFAPRGAFFIVKNEHFVGWKVFDSDGESEHAAIRDIHIPVSADSLLGAAAASLATAAGSHDGDQAFLNPLGFEMSEPMYAIPLIARGRTVAVLYADDANGAGRVNREALETLVLVAGLTVELLASSHSAKPETAPVSEVKEPEVISDYAAYPDGFGAQTPAVELVSDQQPEFIEPDQQPTADYSTDFSFGESSYGRPVHEEIEAVEIYPTEPAFDRVDIPQRDFEENRPEETSFTRPEPAFSPVEPQPYAEQQTPDTGFAFESGEAAPAAKYSPMPSEAPSGGFEPAIAGSGAGFGQVLEPAVQTPAAVVPPPRLSDRPVDLPIEVPEDERRIHNDARRFARLLVSEIKLYNEKKVTEGREAGDLYERLREAIDRSREMYDKRVQPPVAEKFDYFHYELVNALAEGDAARLGSSYPGSTV